MHHSFDRQGFLLFMGTGDFFAMIRKIDSMQKEPFMPIHITLNGKSHVVEHRMDILSLLETLKVPPGSIVVECNRNILHRDMFDRVVLKDGDELELIRFVGGG